ncbi:14851_t:CDS:2, partial [Dentiscutata heterogama]
MTLSPIQRANFATISRLLSCVINEHLVKAFYQSFQHDSSELIHSFAKSPLNNGVIFVLPENDKIMSINNNIIIIPMLYEPILSKDQDNDSTLIKVDFVDPWDMSAPIYQIRYEPFQFVSLDKLKSIIAHPMNKREKINPSEFMSLLSGWVNLGDDKLIGTLCAELESSVKFQVLFPVQLPNIEEKFPYVKILPVEHSIEAHSQASLRALVVPDVPEFAFKLSLGILHSKKCPTINFDYCITRAEQVSQSIETI